MKKKIKIFRYFERGVTQVVISDRLQKVASSAEAEILKRKVICEL